MRPIRGFDRPSLQYLFAIIALVLIAVALWSAFSVRRASREIARLHALETNGRIEREQLEARVAREQSARESLALQLARARSGNTADRQPQMPTLTLSPLTKRGPVPPPPTVVAPGPSDVIVLRLELPAAVQPPLVSYQATLRGWSRGQTVWSRAGLTPTNQDRRRFVQAYVTGDVFLPGSYEVLLTGRAGDGTNRDVASYEVTVGR